MQTSTPSAAGLLRVKREHANMFHLPSRLKRRLRQRRDAISVEVNDLIAAYGVHAYEQARRRNFEANSASEARYWAKSRRKSATPFGQAPAPPISRRPKPLDAVFLIVLRTTEPGRASWRALSNSPMATSSSIRLFGRRRPPQTAMRTIPNKPSGPSGGRPLYGLKRGRRSRRDPRGRGQRAGGAEGRRREMILAWLLDRLTCQVLAIFAVR
jgi:hypothetical protein